MQSKKQFMRKTDIRNLMKKKYDEFIDESFQTTTLDLTSEQIAKILQDKYSQLVNSNIEKNELFIDRISELKKEIIYQEDKLMIQKLISVIDLFLQAEILSLKDYKNLVDFKNTSETNNFSSETFSQPKIRQDIPNSSKNSMRKKIEYPTGEPKLKVLRLKDFEVIQDKNIAEIIFNATKEELGTEHDLDKKMKALKFVDILFNQVDFSPFMEVKKEFYGSVVNGFSTVSSDIDISLETKKECDSRQFLKSFFNEIRGSLQKHKCKVQPLLFENIIVPIIDITIPELNTKISFSVNNKLGVINSRMIDLYSNLDPRCEILGIIVKVWSRMNSINSATNRFLTSYAYILMVINFLQIQKPPILPSLQKLKENDWEAKYLDITSNHKNHISFRARIDYEDDVKKLEQVMDEFYSSNKKDLIELLKEFFQFYGARENFSQKVLSVKNGTHLSRNPLDIDKSYLYSIEDPFDLNNNPGRHVKSESREASKIIDVMNKSYDLLKNGYFKEIFQISKDKDF